MMIALLWLGLYPQPVIDTYSQALRQWGRPSSYVVCPERLGFGQTTENDRLPHWAIVCPTAVCFVLHMKPKRTI